MTDVHRMVAAALFTHSGGRSASVRWITHWISRLLDRSDNSRTSAAIILLQRHIVLIQHHLLSCRLQRNMNPIHLLFPHPLLITRDLVPKQSQMHHPKFRSLVAQKLCWLVKHHINPLDTLFTMISRKLTPTSKKNLLSYHLNMQIAEILPP